MLEIVLHSDGKCVPNPGTATTGFVISSVDLPFRLMGATKLHGKWSSSAAEYTAMVQGLRALRIMLQKAGAADEDCKVLIRTDSQMIAHQNTLSSRMSPICRSLNRRNAFLRHRLLDEAEVIPAGIVRIEHVPRKYNTSADFLTNYAYDNMRIGDGQIWVTESGIHPCEKLLANSWTSRLDCMAKI